MAFHLITKVWQTGALDWWAMIDGKDVYLGSREFPMPPENGDEWLVRATGDRFKVIEGEIKLIGKEEAPEPWIKY